MEQAEIITATINFVKRTLQGAEGGHDWFHIERVWKNAKLIAATEVVDLFVVELAALLHDIADSKFHNGDEGIGPEKASAFLQSLGVDMLIIDHVHAIISNISFKGGNMVANFASPEFNVVQDADRLDALGAVGIARAFNFGGFKNRPLYDPAVAPQLTMSKEEYKHASAPTINHFYEKLLLLQDRLHTATARSMAKGRHNFMLVYLEQFYAEWRGER